MSSSFVPGSFRDRDSRVVRDASGLYRLLSKRGLADWQAVATSTAFTSAVADGRIVGTEVVDTPIGELVPDGDDATRWAGALRHEVVPFVSYPYEWCFGQLKAAAALQLELLAAALEDDLTLKDATPYNIQFRGHRPVFIDVGSYTPCRPGEPWAGYRQFCELFLYPLMLAAYKNVPFQPWLRGSLDGISAEECRALMSWRDRLRPGVLSHVVLHAALSQRHADTSRNVRKDLKDAGFHGELVKANVRRLRRLVDRLDWSPPRSTWSDYSGDNTYDATSRAAKHAFVNRAVGSQHRRMTWDLGANTGEYSVLAAAGADTVVAMDADHLAVERLYHTLAADGPDNILPLVMNLANPSPGQGWALAERGGWIERGRPQLVLALALIHHIVIGAHVPLPTFVAWLASLKGDDDLDLVIEFVHRNDPMVERLLAAKDLPYDDYSRANFETALETHFEVRATEPVPGGTRTLYAARARSGSRAAH